MYLIDDTRFGSSGRFTPVHTRTYFCGDCGKVEHEHYARVKARPRRDNKEKRRQRNLRYRRGAAA
jgi:hypothetical protein